MHMSQQLLSSKIRRSLRVCLNAGALCEEKVPALPRLHVSLLLEFQICSYNYDC